MELGYNILFSLQITLGGIPSEKFTLIPLPSAQALMNDHGMVFKTRPDISFVAGEYFTNDLGVSSILRPVESISRFSFLILINDLNFLRHADLQNSGQDLGRVGRRIYYFSNLDASNAIDGNLSGNQLTMSRSAFVSAADIWSVIPASFSFPVDPAKYSAVELYGILPGQPDKPLPAVYAAGMPQARFLLNGYGPGAYQLRWNGAPARTENIYADNDLVRQNFFALAEIYKDSNANNAILQDKGISYTIPFKPTP